MNLLITGAWRQATEHMPEIERKHAVRFLQCEKDALPCDPAWVEGVVCNGLFLSHPIEQFTNLRYIQLTSAGYDRVPMDYVSEHGIEIHNARGVYSIPMAEFALACVLCLYKRLAFFLENKNAHVWSKERSMPELYGKKVCILGCGSVGTECAKRFKALGCTVYGIDPVVREQESFSRICHADDMKEVLGKSDVVIVTLPLTDQTRHMFDKQTLAELPDGAVFVNIARGALVETDALANELRSGRIGAVLDVFEEEPLPMDNPLWDMENVIVTPHNSFVGEGNARRLSELVMNNLRTGG